jgi:CubicO group peptidase (beta-lactamase class C family)
VAWRTASPAAAGFDPTGLTRVRDRVRDGQYGTVDAVLVIRYGYLVSEQYIGWQPGAPHTMQSVTKSITSLLFGILQARETEAANLDRPVIEVLSRYGPVANLDQRKRALTLRHLLVMRTGMDFWEQPYPGSPLDQLNRSSDDWVRFVLDRPMTAEPGSAWAYNSGAAIVTCGVIREITGENADVFARREFFAPLGITGETWYRSPYDGLPHCGGGLGLKPADLARIGYLVLRGGRWGETQVVPEAWLDASVEPVSRGNQLIFSGFNPGYGYFWWIFPSQRGAADSDVIAASGSGGQWLFVVPRLDLVVAITASNGAGLDLLYDLLPTVR